MKDLGFTTDGDLSTFVYLLGLRMEHPNCSHTISAPSDTFTDLPVSRTDQVDLHQNGSARDPHLEQYQCSSTIYFSLFLL